ncbi:MAG: aminoglycoside phosphotransferase family protein [Bacilli bacterium]|nr:aminoglycoside phosphotransferase family protein [Bacilli bacterium]
MKKSKEYILKVAKEYFNVDSIVDIRQLTSGHINNTFMVTFPECRYILQQINHNVFKSPFGVMNNMVLLTNHIMRKCVYDGKSRNRAGLNLVSTRYDQWVAIVDNEYYRCMEYIEGGVCYEQLTDPQLFFEVGRAVGNFHYMLYDFHSRLIDDPIVDFHNTPKRYINFMKLVEQKRKEDPELIESVKDEINFIVERKGALDEIVNKLEDKTIKRRVCHNDTKLSNVMLDEKTGHYMCLIDLDTAMKGAIAYDFGDALRGGASTALEDEVDLSKVGINLDFVRKFSNGFLLELKGKKDTTGTYHEYISKEEVKTLYSGFRLITIELGMRFLEDYIAGNIYFKINDDRPQHNLERAKNQLALALCVEQNKESIIDIINEALIEYDYPEEYIIKD